MKPKTLFLGIILVLLCVVSVALAQDNVCGLDSSEVVSVVSNICSSVGDNQVCYGNLEVNLIPQDNATPMDFTVPGDLANLNNVRSLFLSELNENADLWGIAQMHLVVYTTQGSQDLVLLLFGDVNVDNEVDNTRSIPITSRDFTNVRSSPHTSAIVMDSLRPHMTVDAVGRIEDSSWLRIRMPDGAVGWVLTDWVRPIDDDADFATLPIQNSTEPYFGAMQAIRLTTGNEPTCGNFRTDGLIIQTPEGTARVTLRINEVTIELIPSTNLGATAFIESNPTDGMTINMIDGSAFVGANNTSYFVNGGSSTTITLDSNSSPIGAPSYPQPFDHNLLGTLPILGVVRNPDAPISIGINPTPDTSVDGGATSNINTDVVTTTDPADSDDTTATSPTTSNVSGTSGSSSNTGSTSADIGSTSDTGSGDSGDAADTGSTSDTGDDGSNGDTEADLCDLPGNACNAPGHNK